MKEDKARRAERLAAALRENLKKRKSQRRAVADTAEKGSEAPAQEERRFREKPIN